MIKVGINSCKYDILTVEEKRVALIVDDTKISLEMTPYQRELEERCLRASKMWIKKLIEEDNNYCQILMGKYVEDYYR